MRPPPRRSPPRPSRQPASPTASTGGPGSVADDAWLVVGLGNPGPSYAKTRPNVGQLVADELAARVGGGWKQHKQARAEVIESRVSGIRTILAKPRSYMNESGGPVSGLLKFFKVEPSSLVVIHDELD